jgi:uncharacterized protein YbgA (DUF1722 family)/uncharacterized protein YbbK (DUF523 family)
MSEKIRLGVSACLLGQKVRYDGQHKFDAFVVETLGKFVEYVPVCPEVECGMPVPRESMRLVGTVEDPRLITHKSGMDMTDQLVTWARCRVVELEKENLCGFIFKSRSPSSGMERVKVYDIKGGMAGRSPGLFAREFLRHFPLLPAEDEGRLQDPELRENFIERIFTLKRYRDAVGDRATIACLMKFHEQHKFLIQSHSTELSREMGRMLAGADRKSAAGLRGPYEAALLSALRLLATPSKHANVLQHMVGFMKKQLTGDEKAELLELIDAMRAGLVPLIVPVTLLKHHVRKHAVVYLRDQVYLNPHPLELKLRNHA